MAAIAGKSGLFRYGALADKKIISRLTNWTISVQSDMLDTTAFSTDGVVWRTVTPGINGWSGTVSGYQDLVTANTTGQRLLLTSLLTPATGWTRFEFDETGLEALVGGVYIESMSFDVPVEGVQGMTCNFRGNGSLAYTTSA